MSSVVSDSQIRLKWLGGSAGSGSRGTGYGIRGPEVWKTRGLVENAGCGKFGVWWKTRGTIFFAKI